MSRERVWLCPIGDPARICSSCKDGNHDFCRGSCEDCGERFHSDPDDFFWLDRTLDMFPSFALEAAAPVDGNRAS